MENVTSQDGGDQSEELCMNLQCFPSLRAQVDLNQTRI